MSNQDPRGYLNDHEEALRLALDSRLAHVWTAMPGIVQSVNLTAMTCTVQLAIQSRMAGPDGQISNINIAILQDVPIVFPRAGQFIVTLPLAQGDEVLVVFAKSCMDSWWQNGGYQNAPMEFRMHDVSDGFAIPGPSSQPKVVTGISSANAQLRTLDGSKYIELTTSGINLVGNVKLTGNLEVTGTAQLDGAVTAQSTIVATGEITGGATAVKLSAHVHPGVTSGPASTGPPTPGS
jgi:hypothetical protein